MRLLMLLAICFSSMTVGSAPAEAKSQREKAALQFDALWASRLAEYRTTSNSASSEHRAAATAIQSDPPFNFNPGDSRLSRLMAAAEADARISGKGSELDAFIRHIEGRPSPGLTEAYLQGRVQKMRDGAEDAERVRLAFASLIHSSGHTIGEILAEVEHTAMTRGDVRGRSEELELVIANWGAYASDYAAASERDRENRARWAAALGAFGRGMAANPTWTASCVRTGDFVNCSGK